MKRKISYLINVQILFISLLTPFYLISQDYDLPDVQLYEIESTNWPDSILQKSFWPNGNLKISYKIIDSTYKLRQNYFKNGNLKSEVKVKQFYFIDTTSTFDYDTYEERITISKGYKDILDGEYFEYFNNYPQIDTVYRTIGQYSNNKRIGKWISHNSEKNKIMFSYINEKIQGEYYMYYGFSSKIKIKGQYDEIEASRAKYSAKTFALEMFKTKEVRRIGKWIYYDIHGNELENVDYNWVEK